MNQRHYYLNLIVIVIVTFATIVVIVGSISSRFTPTPNLADRSTSLVYTARIHQFIVLIFP